MLSAAEKTLSEALQLPVEDRKRIAQELWDSLPVEAQYEFDDEFWAEMKRREQEMNEHPERSLTHEEVMASVREVLREVDESRHKDKKPGDAIAGL